MVDYERLVYDAYYIHVRQSTKARQNTDSLNLSAYFPLFFLFTSKWQSYLSFVGVYSEYIDGIFFRIASCRMKNIHAKMEFNHI